MYEITGSKILITGGAGFIGSSLVESLITNNEIVVVDDLSMGKVANLPKSPRLHFFKHSITDSRFLQQLLTSWNFDYIVLLAAVASVADTIVRPLETHEINQNANISIINVVRKNKLKVKKILFASSAAVYGNNLELPKTEESPIDPLSPYAIDKFATERFVIDFGKLYGIPTVCTRFFNVYGPKQNPESPYSGVLSLISHAAQTNGKFKLFGDGTQSRDFVYIDDVVRALQMLLIQNEDEPTVFNVATGKATELREVIAIFKEISGSNFEVIKTDWRQGDIKESYSDISKIKEFGFVPQFTLRRGLKEYWKTIVKKH